MIDIGDATVETLDSGRVKLSIVFDKAVPVTTRNMKRVGFTFSSEDALQLGRGLTAAGNHAEAPARRTVRRVLRRIRRG